MAFQFFNKNKDQDQAKPETTTQIAPATTATTTIAKETSKPTITTEPVSKIKPKELKKPSAPNPISAPNPAKSEPKLITVTFYGKNIRVVYQDGRILFPIQDVLTIAGVIPSPEHVERLSKHEKLATSWSKLTEKVTVTTDEGKEELIVAQNTNLIHITPYIEGSFPGPFSRWVISLADTLDPDFVAPAQPNTTTST